MPPAATAPGREVPLHVRATVARGTRAGTPSGSRRAGRRAARDPSGERGWWRAPGASIPGPAGDAGETASPHPGESRRVGAVRPVALRQRLEVAGGREEGGGGRALPRHAGEVRGG